VSRDIKILAIETSCDETSASVVGSDYKILSNITYSQIPFHQKTQGVVPEVASRLHEKKIIPTIENALKSAGIKIEQIEAVAVTQGPGLVGSLLVGVETAKTIAWLRHLPIQGVNHIYAHLISPITSFDNFKTIKFPVLVLTASGGHTFLVLLLSWTNYQVLGQTIDDASGEAFDKIATLLGLPYPGGPVLEKLAREFQGQSKIIFPSPKINSDDLNFSFSGLKTAVLYYLQKNPGAKKTEVAYASQQAIIKVLVEKTERAFAQFKPKTIFIAGGVSANNALRQTMIEKFSARAPIYFPAKGFFGDNAGMIGLAFFLNLKTPSEAWDKIKAQPNLKL